MEPGGGGGGAVCGGHVGVARGCGCGGVGHGEAGHGVVGRLGTGLGLLAEAGTAIGEPNLKFIKFIIFFIKNNFERFYLYPCLAELCPLRQFLPGVDVRVLGPLEGLLQLVQLIGREGRPRPTLLPLQRDPGLGLEVRVVVAEALVFD